VASKHKPKSKSKPKPKHTFSAEVLDIIFALILFLASLGYSVMGFPANVEVGCVIWIGMWVFLTHLFFKIQWTETCPKDVKVVLWSSVTFLVVILLWAPVKDQYRKEHSVDVRPTFVRDYDKPLVGIFAIATLTESANRTDLEPFSLHVQLSDTYLNPQKPVLFISLYSTTEQPPSPFFSTPLPGMRTAIWLRPQMVVDVLSNLFVFRYEALNRIEAGGQISTGKTFGTLGDLDHRFIQILCSESLASRIKRINLVANDYVIYSIERSQFSWQEVTRLEPSIVLPAQFAPMKLFQAQLPAQFTNLNFQEVAVRKHDILFSGMLKNQLSYITVWPGDKGWLPEDKD